MLSLLVVGVFAGCLNRPAATDAPIETLGWEDHRLSNSSQPYDKLLVEIDAVEGTEPDAHELAELKLFLAQAIDKPGGVTIRLDRSIPKAIAARRNATSLALEYLNGPDDERTAFLYLLFYRSKLGGLFTKPEPPHFTLFPYPCAVFIDRSYLQVMGSYYQTEFRRSTLLHEVGHALGLARNADHSQRGHCTNAGCMMLPEIKIRWDHFLTFRQPWANTVLCADCRRDLKAYQSAQPKPSDRMWHGYFQRAGDDYQILTRPGFIYVHFGDASKLSLAAVTEKRREAFATPDLLVHYATSEFDPLQHMATLARLLDENPHESIRELGRGQLHKSIEIAESLVATEPNEARRIFSEQTLAAAKAFPEVQARLEALRRRLAQPVK